MKAILARQENLDDPDVLVAVANSVGLDGDAMRTQAQSDEVKALLRANTEEVIERGGYGSPTIFVDKTHMYFGNDQLPLVEFVLKTQSNLSVRAEPVEARSRPCPSTSSVRTENEMNDRVSITVENHVADVRLTRADKMNALDPAMFQGIIAAGEELAAMKGVRAVVLSGEGRSFCAGLDMASMAGGGSQRKRRREKPDRPDARQRQ